MISSTVTYNSIVNVGGNSIPTDVWLSGGTLFQYYAMQYRKVGDVTWLFSPLPPHVGSPGSSAFGLYTISGLASDTDYEYRAWIQVDFTQYNGIAQQVHTLPAPAVVPTVITTALSSIGQISAIGGGNVTADGGAFVSQRGVAWSTLSNPTTADNHSIDGTGTGIFVSSITGLTTVPITGKTYHVRAYAIVCAREQ